MRADAHAHLFRGGYVEGADGADPAVDFVGYQKLRIRAGIDVALVVGYTAEPRHRTNNADILRMAKRAHWVQPLAYLDHVAGAADAQSALESGFVGVAVYATDPTAPVGALLSRILPPLAERRALLSLNVTPDGYGGARRALERHPDVPALLSHLGLVGVGAPDESTMTARLRALAAFADRAATYVKVSGGYALPAGMEADVIAEVVQTFGWRRVVWGSDYPVAPSLPAALDPPWPKTSDAMDHAAALGSTLHALISNVQE